MPVIGIDLGTTYCCVATFVHGKVEIIANDHGNRTTPSYVAFTDIERLVGQPAKDQVAMNTKNTIFDAKRLIGRQYNDAKVREDVQRWPFKVTEVSGKPVLSVMFKGEQKNFAPEQISAMLLSKMKETAEVYLDKSVTEAVITVPAYFNDSQRQATKDAGIIAGLSVLRILNEPTAAALAYGMEKNLKGKRIVLIFDLGGGTFDVSLLHIDEGSRFKVLAVAGDTHLGGEDFDSRLVKYFADLFKRKYKMDLTGSTKSLRRLRIAAEHAKRTLSFSNETTIAIDSLYEGIDFCTTLTRARFEELCIDLFNQTLQPVNSALHDAKIGKSQVDDIVLVGGSTRIPKIQNLLQSFFGGKKLTNSINPDEAVAYGAAIQAAMLAGDMSSEIRELLLVDVVPLSLGVRTFKDGVENCMSKVIERNTRIPCKRTRTFYTMNNNQTSLKFPIFEGEYMNTERNHLLGSFALTGVPPAPMGEAVDVTFDLDANGILNVTAKMQKTGNVKSITIHHEKGRLPSSEINRMIEEAKKLQKEDAMLKQQKLERRRLELLALGTIGRLDRMSDTLLHAEKSKIEKACLDAMNWMEEHAILPAQQIAEKITVLHDVCVPLLDKLGL